MKFFTDAVVAIAMTLLILPLLESVSTAADEGLGTADYLRENGTQLFAFVLSFVIISRFSFAHEKLFDSVRRGPCSCPEWAASCSCCLLSSNPLERVLTGRTGLT